MVIGTFTGWSGPPLVAPVERAMHRQPSVQPLPGIAAGVSEVVYAMRPASKDTIVVTVVSPEICMRKSVRSNGQVRVEMDRGSDRIAISTEGTVVAVTRGARTAKLDVSSVREVDLLRLRSLLVDSPAVRAFRILATAVDETETDTAERMSLRLAGTLTSQFDGDQGAIRRLSRELHARYGSRVRRVGRRIPDDWFAYKRGVVRACAELQLNVAALNCWNPARNACALTWLLQVEAAWYAYVAASIAGRPRG